jgi:hypothetical protein
MSEEYKTKKPTDPALIDILNQLHISIALCENASQKVTDSITKDKIGKLVDKKKIFVKEIVQVFDIDLQLYLEQNKESIELQCQKVIQQFENLFLEGNDEKLIAFIISTEKKSQKLYQTLTISKKYDEFAIMILDNQLSESRRDMLELNEIQNEYL